MKTEPVQIDIETMDRLRMFVSKKNKGKTYGLLGKTVSKAINEYIDLIELRAPTER